MCGIAGVVSREVLSPSDRGRVERSGQAMVHRGPDGSGDFSAPHVALAMRRLAIIDPNGGWQPLYNEDRSIALVVNGEIYNYLELRRELTAKGHRFATGSDCETIAHLYEDYGLEFVDHLRGMFAIALWDQRRKRFVLARDRMGEKPLYLFEEPGRLSFASEMKALLASGRIPFELDPAAIDAFLHWQYVPEPATAIRGVVKLPAGSMLVVDVESWTLERRRYWRMEDAEPLDGDPATVLRQEFERVGELIVRSDVPVGVALSGGLDSSAVAALAARQYSKTLHAFTVGYQGKVESDERPAAAAFARHLQIPFHEVEVAGADVVDFFRKLNEWRDDPIADISGHGYFAVSRAARAAGVPVLLQGQGGDELFWGYSWVHRAVADAVESNPSGQDWHGAFGAVANRTTPRSWRDRLRSCRGQIAHLPELLAGLGAPTRLHPGGDHRLPFITQSPDFQHAWRWLPSLYSEDYRRRLSDAAPDDCCVFDRPWPRLDVAMTQLICQTYLCQNGLAQGDRLSSANSVELRLPLVDYRLVETVIGLRKARSDWGLPPKAWFRAMLGDLLPEWVMQRPKRGFTPPVRQWHDEIFRVHGRLLEDGLLVAEGVFTAGAAQSLARGPFPIGAATPLSFKALCLEVWCRAMKAIADEARRTTALEESPTILTTRASKALAPVALFCFRRPEHTQRTLAELTGAKLANKTELHVYCDGPRHAKDVPGVDAVRDVVQRHAWPGKIVIHESPHNRGLAASIAAGVTELTEQHGRVIVVEDDLLVAPEFLKFMNAGLFRYENDDRVMQLGGYVLPNVKSAAPFLLPVTTSWGWATWRRAWRHYDPRTSGIEKLTVDPELRARFDLDGAYPYFQMLADQRAGRIDSWAIRWYLSVFLQGGLVLYPPQSLVDNIGWDGSGAHCGVSASYQSTLHESANSNWDRRFPADTTIDTFALSQWVRELRAISKANGGSWPRLRAIAQRIRRWKKRAA